MYPTQTGSIAFIVKNKVERQVQRGSAVAEELSSTVGVEPIRVRKGSIITGLIH
ncbi:hypothetical protein [Mycobacterium sp. 050134]|uniref:hypothetical protein n=1 Tax=Mycobacterium sp. 050134 TaxID=3096111 RepID=UPI002EDAA38C